MQPITIKNVRLTFSALFQPNAGKDGNKKPEYQATFLLDKEKDAKQIEAIRAAMNAAAVEMWGQKMPNKLKSCLQDGNDKETQDGRPYDGFPGNMAFKTHSQFATEVYNYDMKRLTEDSGLPYDGCYVNAVANVYAWHHTDSGTNGVSAFLTSVQFANHGAPLKGNKFDATSYFDVLPPPDTTAMPEATGEPFVAGKPQQQSPPQSQGIGLPELPF